jgi:hypothetical protein
VFGVKLMSLNLLLYKVLLLDNLRIMNESLQDFLLIVCPSLSEDIASLNGMMRVKALAEILPSVPLVTDAGFECHLTKDKKNADISIAFSKNTRHLLFDSFSSLSCLANESNSWKKVQNLIEKWTNQKSLLYEHIENIWLEFDIDDHTSGVLEPSVFFSPYPLILSPSATTSNFAKYEWIIEEIELLINQPISSATKECISKCFNLLPKGGTIFQVGVMLPRLSESKSVRLCIQGIEIPKITEYLNSIGWNDSTGEITSLLDELIVCTDSVAVNVSIENVVQSKIGIECYVDKRLEAMLGWENFFNFMLKNKICTSDKIARLVEWPGSIEEQSHQQKWPDNLSKAARFVYPNLRSAAVKVISHIKIVYQPMVPLQAKAYLWFGHRWIRPDGSLQQ